MSPEALPNPCEAMLHHVFNAIPDLLTVHDRDFNTILSNWHGYDMVPAAARQGRPKCYQVYHHRDQPCEACHVQKVFASGQPQKTEKINLLDGKTREFSAFPVLSESGQVILVAEHVRDRTDRHLAEQALKESEGRFRTLIEDSPESLFLTDVRGTILAASRVAAQRLGKSLAEVTGAIAFDLFPPEVAAHRRPFFDQAVATGRPVRFEDTRDNFHFEIHINPILDADGKVSRLSFMGLDITDRKNAEQALKEKTRLNQILLDAFPCVALLLRPRTREIVAANAEAVKAGAFPGTKCFRTWGQRQDPCPWCLAPALWATGEAQHSEVEASGIAWEAHWIPVAEDLYMHFAFDITARKQAEAALKESEERFRMLFEHAPDAYILADMQGEIIDCNQATEELAGYGREELIGNNFACLPWLDFRQQVKLADLLAQAARGEAMGPVDFTLTRKDGGEVIAEGVNLPLYIQGQNLVLTIVRDITARKQAEEALRESEARYRTLFEASPDALILMDLDMNIIMENQRGLEMVGHDSLEQFMSRSSIDDIASEDRPRVKAAIKVLLATGRTQTFETTMVKQDGARFPSLNSVALVRDVAGRPQTIIGIARDITALKQAEAGLRESEELFRSLVEHITLGITMINSDYRITMTNPAQGNLFHKHPREFIGKECFREFEKRPAVCPLCPGTIAMATGQKAEIETTGVRDDGSSLIARIHAFPSFGPDGEINGFIEVVEDITQSKQVEVALRQSEQRFRLMAETIQDVFWIANPGTGKMEYVSPGYEQVWGRTCQELYQSPQSFLETVHPEDRERVKTEIIAARERSIPWDHEYRIIKPDGAVRWIHDRGFPVRDDQDRVTLYTGVARDITEPKALEQQLLQSQKMEAVGRLAGGIAHDFNNLLMAITGYGELMRAKVLKEDPLYGYLENILKAGDRAAALTQQLLTFSRQKIVHPQVIDLNRVVLDLEPMLRRLIGEDLDLEVVTDRRLGAVKADPGQLGQIIMNLVVNARDAMPQGGRLTLKTAPVNFTVGCHNRFGLTPPGAYVRLEVQDTGVGMDETTQAHVFEPFFTTKEPGKGTGLGLSIVYGIVKQSGGYLDLDSSPGAGSTFSIYLPRLEAIVEPPKAKIPITASFRGEETILLVEDEDVLRGLLAKFLRLYGYTVLEARHGGEALLACERHQGPIHVMVTDVVMPQMSGRELADRLTPLRPEMEIIYMSGYTEDALIQHGVADLSVAFLQKPFRPIELARRVYAVLHPPVSR
jgi:PAS domain S-box-containing protein